MNIAILSDLHANCFALDKVLDDIGRRDVEKILIAGDLIGYYYWPRDVVEFCQTDSRVVCIKGNHEVNLESAINDTQAMKRLTAKYGHGYMECVEQLTDTQLSWLFALPLNTTVEFGGMSFFMSHGSLAGCDEYIYPNSDQAVLLQNYAPADVTIFGHTHYPFTHFHEGKIMVNPGSVGQPRDFGSLASYALVNTKNQTIVTPRIVFDAKPLTGAVAEKDPDLPYLGKVMHR